MASLLPKVEEAALTLPSGRTIEVVFSRQASGVYPVQLTFPEGYPHGFLGFSSPY